MVETGRYILQDKGLVYKDSEGRLYYETIRGDVINNEWTVYVVDSVALAMDLYWDKSKTYTYVNENMTGVKSMNVMKVKGKGFLVKAELDKLGKLEDFVEEFEELIELNCCLTEIEEDFGYDIWVEF